MRKVEVITQVLNANQENAGDNRKLLKEHQILGVNLMASPGAGKTSLILQTALALAGTYRLGVIEGDVASRIDADKVASADIPLLSR
jgi:hydrogenase nickel incorporation protein HypB